MTTQQAFDEIDKLSVYMDYYITNRAIEIQYGSIGAYLWSFEDFTTKPTQQSGMILIDEWVWKWPERFKTN